MIINHFVFFCRLKGSVILRRCINWWSHLISAMLWTLYWECGAFTFFFSSCLSIVFIFVLILVSSSSAFLFSNSVSLYAYIIFILLFIIWFCLFFLLFCRLFPVLVSPSYFSVRSLSYFYSFFCHLLDLFMPILPLLSPHIHILSRLSLLLFQSVNFADRTRQNSVVTKLENQDGYFAATDAAFWTNRACPCRPSNDDYG
jgi:hypothetical protein